MEPKELSVTTEQQGIISGIVSLTEAVSIVKKAEQDLRESWALMAGAIQVVKEQELWREGGHPNFESFIRIELGYSKQWVYKLLKIPRIVDKIDVTNPTAATELTSLPEDKWQDAWDDMNPIKTDFRNIVNVLRFAKPYSECFFCNGEGCEKCLDSGVLIRERFDAYEVEQGSQDPYETGQTDG